LEEEMDQRKEMVGDLGRALRETVPEGLKDRVEEAMRESVAIATRGRRYVDHVKTRLDFSKDSESGSSKAATGAAVGGGRLQRRSSEKCLQRAASQMTSRKMKQRERREWLLETCWTS
jgi:hypothetical protein